MCFRPPCKARIEINFIETFDAHCVRNQDWVAGEVINPPGFRFREQSACECVAVFYVFVIPLISPV